MTNLIALEGVLARDPMFKFTPKGTPVCSFDVINIYSYTNSSNIKVKEKYFFRIEAWGALATKCNSLVKGSQVEIEGRIKEDRWQNPDGTHHSKMVIIPKSVDPCKLEESINIDDCDCEEDGKL